MHRSGFAYRCVGADSTTHRHLIILSARHTFSSLARMPHPYTLSQNSTPSFLLHTHIHTTKHQTAPPPPGVFSPLRGRHRPGLADGRAPCAGVWNGAFAWWEGGLLRASSGVGRRLLPDPISPHHHARTHTQSPNKTNIHNNQNHSPPAGSACTT